MMKLSVSTLPPISPTAIILHQPLYRSVYTGIIFADDKHVMFLFGNSGHILCYSPRIECICMLKHNVLWETITVHISIVMWLSMKVLCKCVKRYYISPTISENVIIHFSISAIKGTLSHCSLIVFD